MFVFVCKGYPTYIRRSRRTVLGHNHVIRGAEAPLPRRLYHGHLDVNSQSPVFDRISLKHTVIILVPELKQHTPPPIQKNWGEWGLQTLK